METKSLSPFCEARYGEFPEMLFGTVGNGNRYFDAGYYIREKGNTEIHSIEDFKRKFDFWIQATGVSYDIPASELFVSDKNTGNVLMEECLSLLFIAYIDPAFAVYMLERISEMLTTGIALSDTTLLAMAKERLTKEDLMYNK